MERIWKSLQSSQLDWIPVGTERSLQKELAFLIEGKVMFKKCLDVLKWGGGREVWQGVGAFSSPGLCLHLVEEKPCSLMEKMI